MKRTVVLLFCIFVLVACIKPDNFNNNSLEKFWQVASSFFYMYGEVLHPNVQESVVTEENGMLNVFPGTHWLTSVWQDGTTQKDEGMGMYNFAIEVIPNPLILSPSNTVYFLVEYSETDSLGGSIDEWKYFHMLYISQNYNGKLSGECNVIGDYATHETIDLDMSKPLWLILNRDGIRLVAYYKQNVDDPWTRLEWEDGVSHYSDMKVVRFSIWVNGQDSAPQTILFDDFEVDFREMISR